MGNFIDVVLKAGALVDAVNDLPPTYETSHDGEYFDQFIPDPVTPQSVQRKLDAVDKAQREFDQARNK